MSEPFDNIIISQAPRDLTKVISLYEKLRSTRTKIYVVNCFANFVFLKSLKLSADIEFVPHKEIKYPQNLLKMIFVIYSRYFFQLKRIEGANVYFFSRYFDYVTAIFVNRLKQKNNIFFNDLFKAQLSELNPSITQRAVLSTFQFAFRTKLKRTMIGQTPGYYFDLPLQTREIDIPTEIPSKYKQKVTQDTYKSVLIFDGRGDKKEYYLSYEKNFLKVLSSIPEDFKVYIKPHPRIGHTPFLEQQERVKIISKGIPGEFLVPQEFTFILGIETTALIDFVQAEAPVYSIMPLFDIEPKSYKFFKGHLDKLSNGEMKYISSLEELNKKLASL